MRKLPQLPPPQFDYLPFAGGLDLTTPVIQTKPGTLRDALNYEIGINGGYIGILGYERFDGQASPSDGQYGILNVTISGAFAVGDTITGVTSAATAVVLAVVTGGATDYLVVTKISGTFVAETLNVSGSPQGTITAAPSVDGASTTQLHAQYRNLAADEYRDDIAAVTGSGRILGLWMLDDVVYAFRNNAGGTAAALYKSTASGWSAVALGRELSFTSGGTYEILEGDTITGATSAATAVITRVVLETGSWGAGTAAGRLIFASDTGTFQAENLNVGANLNVATIADDSSAITLLPDGRYEMITHNFGGEAGEDRIYGCDGINRGFEFDGAIFVPIDTGMDDDTPSHVSAHKNHLFFAFVGSAQHSGIGTPYIFSPVFGASELAVGDTITGFKREPGVQAGATLGIYSRNIVHMLYGTSSSDWELVQYREELGAYANSIQQVGGTMMLDDRGIVSLQASQVYGNFQHSVLSKLIQPFVNERRTLVTASCIARDKSQYRLFFSDQFALFITMNGSKVLGMMPQLLEHKVECMFSLEDSDGNEVIMFGSDDGFVYQMEKGTSFDGESINRYFKVHYHHSKSPRVNKAYKGLTLEAEGTGYAEFGLTYELGYTDSDIPQPGTLTEELSFSAGRWDTGTWDVGVWDGRTLQPSNFKLEGTAENISLIIMSDSDYFAPVKYSGALLRLIPRRQLR